jgi:hypothetical protein
MLLNQHHLNPNIRYNGDDDVLRSLLTSRFIKLEGHRESKKLNEILSMKVIYIGLSDRIGPYSWPLVKNMMLLEYKADAVSLELVMTYIVW